MNWIEIITGLSAVQKQIKVCRDESKLIGLRSKEVELKAIEKAHPQYTIDRLGLREDIHRIADEHPEMHTHEQMEEVCEALEV